MAKRLIDEAIWLSEKVKKMPESLRLHYANWIPLAEANGVFEANSERIYSRLYSFLLPDFNSKCVRRLIISLHEVALVRFWKQDGKVWGYFVGMEKGRLPAHIERFRNLPPNPPQWAVDGTTPDETMVDPGVTPL